MPVPRLAVEPARAATSASRTRTGPTAAGGSAPIRWSSATSRSTSGTTSRAANRSSTRPTSSPASTTAAAPPTTTRSSGCTAQGLETASAVRARERRRLRALQVRAQDPDRAGVHPARLRRAGVLRRLHHHLRRRRRPEDRGRQQRRRGHQRRTRHRGDQELGNDRQPHHLGDHPGRRVHLRRPVHGVHRPHARAEDPARAEAKASEFGAGGHPAVRARTSTSGRTSAIPIRPRWPARSTRASPPSASGPSSSIPTAAAAAPPNCHAARKAEPQ